MGLLCLSRRFSSNFTLLTKFRFINTGLRPVSMTQWRGVLGGHFRQSPKHSKNVWLDKPQLQQDIIAAALGSSVVVWLCAYAAIFLSLNIAVDIVGTAFLDLHSEKGYVESWNGHGWRKYTSPEGFNRNSIKILWLWLKLRLCAASFPNRWKMQRHSW